MNEERSHWVLAAKIIFAIFIVFIGWKLSKDSGDSSTDPSLVFSSFLKFLLLGGLLVAVFFFDIIGGVGQRVAGFIFPEAANVELRPEYSVAESRAREGNYADAIEEFRIVLKKYPNSVTPHVRIAEILCKQFGRYDDAMVEMKAALAKKSKPDTWAFVANRMVDVQVEYLHDFPAARDTLQQIILKLPGSKFSEAASARVLALNDREANQKSGDRPRLKIRDGRGGSA